MLVEISINFVKTQLCGLNFVLEEFMMQPSHPSVGVKAHVQSYFMKVKHYILSDKK